jgi:hypothetical protein
MKNWLKFEHGHWLSINAQPQEWQNEGIVYIDPNAITHVATQRNIHGGCVIFVNSDKNHIVTNLSIDEVISRIQSAL